MLTPKLFTENSLFEDFFDDYGFMKAFRDLDHKLYGKHLNREMLTDVREKEDHYELLVDLPGFKKENIRIELNNGYLSIEASKGIEENDEENGKTIRQERYYGTMQRSFYIGDSIRKEDISAKFDSGVLTLNIPKIEVRKEIPADNVIEIE